MMMFAKQAAKYFDNAEIIELHHNQKKDAPSGTAIKTALMMSEARDGSFTTGNCPETETIQGARGANSYSDIHIHSVRMPGLYCISGGYFRCRRSNPENQARHNGQKMLYGRSASRCQACSPKQRFCLRA